MYRSRLGREVYHSHHRLRSPPQPALHGRHTVAGACTQSGRTFRLDHGGGQPEEFPFVAALARDCRHDADRGRRQAGFDPGLSVVDHGEILSGGGRQTPPEASLLGSRLLGASSGDDKAFSARSPVLGFGGRGCPSFLGEDAAIAPPASGPAGALRLPNNDTGFPPAGPACAAVHETRPEIGENWRLPCESA